MGFQGDLDSFGLATIFQTLTAGKHTGTLHVYDNESSRYLIFTEGAIRSARTGERRAISLGEILVARGAINQATLEGALACQADSDNFLGELLVRENACTQEQVNSALRFQMEEAIYDLFTWHGAKFEFQEARIDETTMVTAIRTAKVEINTSGLLFEAMRRIDEWQRLAQYIPSGNFIPVIPAESKNRPEIANLSQQEFRIISFVTGENDIDEITRRCCLGRYAVIELLSRLVKDNLAREATPPEMQDAAERLVLQGDLHQAEVVLRRLMQIDGSNLNARSSYASVLEGLNKAKDAAREYGIISDRFCEQKNFEDAVSACARAAELAAKDIQLHEKLANLLVLTDQLKDAGSAWVTAIGLIEKSGNKKLALEKIEYALQDVNTCEELYRIQARILMELGDGKQAISCYEQLAATMLNRGDTGGAVTALKNALRIDSNRKDIQDRINSMQMTDAERQRRKKLKYVSLAVAAGAAILVLTAAINELGVKREKDSAANEARKIMEESALPDAKRIEALDRAILRLSQAGKPFSLLNLGESDRKETLADAERLRASISQETEIVKKEQSAIINDWLRLQKIDSKESRDAFENLRALSESSPETAEVSDAKKLVAEQLRKVAAKEKDIESLIKSMGDKTAPSKDRIVAYRKFLEKHPDLIRNRSGKLAGITIGVEVTALTNMRVPVSASVALVTDDGEKAFAKTGETVELPVAIKSDIVLSRKGYGSEILVRPGEEIKEAYRLSLKRTPRWQKNFRGIIEGTPAISDDQRTAFTANTNGEITAHKLDNGDVLWKKSPSQKAIFRLQPKFTEERIVAVAENGTAYLLRARNGETISPAGGQAPFPGISSTGFTLTSFSSGNETSSPDVIITSQSGLPVYAINSGSGKIIWPQADLLKNRITQKIGAATGAAFHDRENHNVFVLGKDGVLHVLLEDGTYVGGSPVLSNRIEGDPLFYNDKNDKENNTRLIIAERGVGIECYEVKGGKDLGITQLWKCSEFSSRSVCTKFLRAGDNLYAGLDSGAAIRIAMKDGSCAKIRGELSGRPGGQPALDGNLLLLPLSGNGGGLAAVSVKGTTPGEQLWTYPIDRPQDISGVAVTQTPGSGYIIFAANSALYCFDREADE